MDARTAWAAAHRLNRIAEADPGYDFNRTLTRSGRNPTAYGHVNPTRDEAVRIACSADPRAISHLSRFQAPAFVSRLRAQFQHDNPRMYEIVGNRKVDAGHANRRFALRNLSTSLLYARTSMKGYMWDFDTFGYRLLDAKAQRMAAEHKSRAAETEMLAMAARCVTATERGVAAMRVAA